MSLQSINGWHIYSSGKMFLLRFVKHLVTSFIKLVFFQRRWTSTMSKKRVRKITISDQKRFNGIALSNFKAHEDPEIVGVLLPCDEMGYVNACIDEVPGDFGRNGIPVGRTHMVGHGEAVHSLPPWDRIFRFQTPTTECPGSMQEQRRDTPNGGREDFTLIDEPIHHSRVPDNGRIHDDGYAEWLARINRVSSIPEPSTQSLREARDAYMRGRIAARDIELLRSAVVIFPE